MSRSNTKQKRPSPPSLKSKHSANRKNPTQALIISFLAGAAVFFVSVLILSFLLEKSPDPNALIPAAAIICTILAAAVSGSAAAKLLGKATPWSILSGLIMILFYLIMSLFFDNSAESGIVLKSAIVVILPLMALVAGVFAGRNKPGKKPR